MEVFKNTLARINTRVGQHTARTPHGTAHRTARAHPRPYHSLGSHACTSTLLAAQTARSTSGWVVFWQSAALTWGSRKQKSIALSTCEAEIIALSEAAKDVVYLRKLVSGVGDAEPGPTPLATDSQSARDVSYNPEHHDRMKHVERRHYFVRDMVESLKIEVPLVRTAENWADFFTKTFDAKKFHAMRRVIMNEA